MADTPKPGRHRASEAGTNGGTVKGKPQKESDPKDEAYDKPKTFGKGWR